ncbi:ribosomal protein L32p [marine bacterium AO1-C]|nr:ribosomal protein L32p [marine bacterium AO1-C]
MALGKHRYEFSSRSDFFTAFPNSLVQKGEFKVLLDLEKSETLLKLDFHIQGNLELECDRSLELFDFPFEVEKTLILKFGEYNEALSDEMEMIHRDTQTINIAQYVYEFIGLAIPMKKLHPRFQQSVLEGLEIDDEDEDDNSTFVYSSESSDSTEQTDEENIDPRWQKLKNLKNKGEQ